MDLTSPQGEQNRLEDKRARTSLRTKKEERIAHEK